MNLRELFKNGSGESLPEPTVTQRMSGDDGPWTAEQVRGIQSNPCYAGIGPYPGLVSEVDWVHSAIKVIEQDGAEQFLVNVLAMLRASFENAELNFGGE
jgi:hypothetical protein